MTSGATGGLHSEVLQTFSVEVQTTRKTAQLTGVQLNENAQNLQSEHTCVIITQIERLPEGPPGASHSSSLMDDLFFPF